MTGRVMAGLFDGGSFDEGHEKQAVMRSRSWQDRSANDGSLENKA
jgi:hypothetical protein